MPESDRPRAREIRTIFNNLIFRYQSQHDTVIPPLKPIGQTFVKVDNQAKVVATKITIDSRSPAVSLNQPQTKSYT